MFVCRRKIIAGTPYHWSVGLFNMKSTSAAMWRVELVPVGPSSEYDVVMFAHEGAGVRLVPVLEWASITARRTQWHSPCWQAEHMPDAFDTMGVRLFALGPEKPLIVIMADLCWCAFDTVELSYIAKAHHIAVRGSTFLCYLVDMTMDVLEMDELAALDHLKDKIGFLMPDDEWDLIMEIDEAQQVLTKEDASHVETEQKKNKNSKASFRSFCLEYQERKHRARDRAASGRGGAGGGGGAAASRKPARHLRECDVSQEQGKAFMPPGGRLWQDRSNACWLARVPPMKPARAKWDVAGADAAQLVVIAAAWQQYCILEGIPDAECPMGGIFAEHAGSVKPGKVGKAKPAETLVVAPASGSAARGSRD